MGAADRPGGQATLEDAIAWLARLVAYPTVSSASNLPLIDEVEAFLRGLGVPAERFPDPTGRKAALLATFGPMVAGGVVLSGHTDVVPAAGQPWTTDPFRLHRAGGRLYGRGSCDMKGFAAAILALAPRLASAPLARPIHLLLSYDEETTCLGCVDAIASFGRDRPMPAAVIVGEPTGMAIADAHKSVGILVTEVHGHASHSSRPEAGVNAIIGAGMVAAELARLDRLMAERGDSTGRFDPPRTTVHVGMIAGGEARNIVPTRCRLDWEFRGLPGFDHGALLDDLASRADSVIVPAISRPGLAARVETTLTVLVPPLAPEPGSEAERLAFRLTGSNRTTAVAFATEAGHFQRAGIPTIVCGPGDIAQAHQPDEWLAESELARCLRFLEALAETLAR